MIIQTNALREYFLPDIPEHGGEQRGSLIPPSHRVTTANAFICCSEHSGRCGSAYIHLVFQLFTFSCVILSKMVLDKEMLACFAHVVVDIYVSLTFAITL